jgi:hypothetical protein
LYSEDQQRQERKVKEATTSPLSIPPINITNVLPSSTQQVSLNSGLQSDVAHPPPLSIDGFRDDALREYTAWQQSKVRDPLLKNEYSKACDAALQIGFDLEQIHEKQDADFFIQAGVIRGVAERFPRDILPWSKTLRGDSMAE